MRMPTKRSLQELKFILERSLLFRKSELEKPLLDKMAVLKDEIEATLADQGHTQLSIEPHPDHH